MGRFKRFYDSQKITIEWERQDKARLDAICKREKLSQGDVLLLAFNLWMDFDETDEQLEKLESE